MYDEFPRGVPGEFIKDPKTGKYYTTEEYKKKVKQQTTKEDK